MLDIHAILRLVFNIGALIFGFRIYCKVNHIGILALVASAGISSLLGIGLILDALNRSAPLYHWTVDLIRLLAMTGLYYIWQAVNEISE